jgi:hypothetical protein
MKIDNYDEGAYHAGNEGTKKDQDTRPLRGHQAMLSQQRAVFGLLTTGSR